MPATSCPPPIARRPSSPRISSASPSRPTSSASTRRAWRSRGASTRNRSVPGTSGGPSAAPSGWPSSTSGGARWRRPAGWLAKAERLVGEGDGERVESGYLLIAAAVAQPRHRRSGRGPATRTTRAVAIGTRFGDPDLVVLARIGVGESLIELGETDARHRTHGRGHGRGHLRRGVARDRRHRLLHRHRCVPAGLRPAPGAGVDHRPRSLVRVPAAARALPRTVPAESRRAQAVPRRVAGRRRRGANRRASDLPSRRPIRPSARRSTRRPSSIGCAGSSLRPRRRTGARAGSVAGRSPGSPSFGWPRAGTRSPRPPCRAPPTRPPASSPAPGCSSRSSRSCWPPARRRRRDWQRTR